MFLFFFDNGSFEMWSDRIARPELDPRMIDTLDGGAGAGLRVSTKETLRTDRSCNVSRTLITTSDLER